MSSQPALDGSLVKNQRTLMEHLLMATNKFRLWRRRENSSQWHYPCRLCSVYCICNCSLLGKSSSLSANIGRFHSSVPLSTAN